MYLMGVSSRSELLWCIFHELVEQTVSCWVAVSTASTASTARRFDDEDTSTIPIITGDSDSGALSCDNRSLSSSSRGQQYDWGEAGITERTVGNSQARDQVPYRSSGEWSLLRLEVRR